MRALVKCDAHPGERIDKLLFRLWVVARSVCIFNAKNVLAAFFSRKEEIKYCCAQGTYMEETRGAGGEAHSYRHQTRRYLAHVGYFLHVAHPTGTLPRILIAREPKRSSVVEIGMDGAPTIPSDAAEWYYVGHYGQLGPLTLEQMSELARDGVIDGETYVWRPSMANWLMAKTVPELINQLPSSFVPPPTPMQTPPVIGTPPAFGQPHPHSFQPTPPSGMGSPVSTPYGSQSWHYMQSHLPQSDKSRLVGGLLNVIPGFGRLYLGYAAHGILQLLTMFCGIGFIWSWIDGIFILAGGVKYDGYGRRLDDPMI